MNFFTAAFIGSAVFAVYWIFVRPILRAQPSLATFWAQEDSFVAALKLKFAGAKQKLTTIAFLGAGVIVEAHDQLAPLASQAGVDVTQILPQIPAAAWPFITMGALALVQYFRTLSDRSKPQ